jgi:hypothetical protein
MPWQSGVRRKPDRCPTSPAGTRRSGCWTMPQHGSGSRWPWPAVRLRAPRRKQAVWRRRWRRGHSRSRLHRAALLASAGDAVSDFPELSQLSLLRRSLRLAVDVDQVTTPFPLVAVD